MNTHWSSNVLDPEKCKKTDRKLLNDTDIVRSISIGKSPYFLGSRAGDFFVFRRKFYENRTYQEAKGN